MNPEQVVVKFPDGAEVRAVIMQTDDNGNYKCSAMEKTDKYKQGDIFYANENTHRIIRQSVYVRNNPHSFDTSKPDYDELQRKYPNVNVFKLLREWEEEMSPKEREEYGNSFNDYVRMLGNVEIRHVKNMTKLSGIKNLLNNYVHRKNVGFDIHKSPWKFNKITGKIEKDPEAIQKIAMRIKTALEYYPYEGLNSDYKHQERLNEAERRVGERELKAGDEGMYHGAEVKIDGFDDLGSVEFHEIQSKNSFKVNKDDFVNEFSKFPSKLGSLNRLMKTALDVGDNFAYDSKIPKDFRYKEFELSGKLIYQNNEWWIEPHVNSVGTLALGVADEYKIPEEWVKDWNLNSLLEGNKTETKLGSLNKFIKNAFGTKTPEEYKEKMRKRYEENPEQEFIDNYEREGRDPLKCDLEDNNKKPNSNPNLAKNYSDAFQRI